MTKSASLFATGAMTALMKDTYDGFVSKALEGRKKAGRTMTREQLLELAGGRVWTGRQAKANGLIDELGTVGDAILAAKKMAGVQDNNTSQQLPHFPSPAQVSIASSKIKNFQ